MWSRLRAGALALALALGVPASVALAAPPAAVVRLEAECARLRAELDRANADVAALKRADRGVRDDYRLRQRLADAEALARKLTAAEAELRASQGAPATARPALAPPHAAPGDGPVELTAKADLLADQAQRLAVEADGLARTAGQIRGKQLLTRRANQLERDPFAGIETSKRTLVFSGARGATLKTDNSSKSGSKAPSPQQPTPTTGGGSTSTGGGTRSTTGGSSGTGGSAGSSGGAGDSAGPTTNPSMPPTSTPPMGAAPGASGANMPPSTNQPSTPVTATPPPKAPGVEIGGSTPQPTGALSSQLRTLLDPATLAEVERWERTGRPMNDPEALEKLASALKQRAQALDAESKRLRTQARP